jgi:hypothetical protein
VLHGVALFGVQSLEGIEHAFGEHRSAE